MKSPHSEDRREHLRRYYREYYHRRKKARMAAEKHKDLLVRLKAAAKRLIEMESRDA